MFAFIVLFIAAGTFYLLWQEERKKLAEAQEEIKRLKKRRQPPKPRKTATQPPKPKTPTEYVIRKPEPKPAKQLLDQKKLAELLKETKEAQGMLAEIFVQEEETVRQPEERASEQSFMGVLQKLLEKEVWTRAEVAEIAGPNVMIGNLLEQINDYACSKIDDIVLEEDGDRIYVTIEYRDQLI